LGFGRVKTEYFKDSNAVLDLGMDSYDLGKKIKIENDFLPEKSIKLVVDSSSNPSRSFYILDFRATSTSCKGNKPG
tara:strand:- start:93 stop:320 length:228 start_codon:yes stop_codon:yes gene_type:complete